MHFNITDLIKIFDSSEFEYSIEIIFMSYIKNSLFPDLEEINHQIFLIKKGCEEILVGDEFERKFREVQLLGKRKPLIVKLGLDPTSPDVHLGHTILLNKLRKFQDFGHVAIFLVGDFTAAIGDPSGKISARPSLTEEQIKENANTYCEQVSKILNLNNLQILYNSKWYNDLGACGLVKLASCCTVARMIERQDFSNRLKKGFPISVCEFLYPLIQGYDSVAIDADIELGGVDQKFNLLMGRELQKEYGQEPQCIMTMPLLIGIDGSEKMSKSKNNYIGITESPGSMFGKLMSISDSLMWEYFNLLSSLSFEELQMLKIQTENGRNPREIKILLAKEIVSRFHGANSARKSEEDFEARFRFGSMPDIMPEVNLSPAPMNILKILKESNLVVSTSEAQRNILQGGVRINSQRIENKSLNLEIGTYIIQVGKRRFARVRLF